MAEKPYRSRNSLVAAAIASGVTAEPGGKSPGVATPVTSTASRIDPPMSALSALPVCFPMRSKQAISMAARAA